MLEVHLISISSPASGSRLAQILSSYYPQRSLTQAVDEQHLKSNTPIGFLHILHEAYLKGSKFPEQSFLLDHFHLGFFIYGSDRTIQKFVNTYCSTLLISGLEHGLYVSGGLRSWQQVILQPTSSRTLKILMNRCYSILVELGFEAIFKDYGRTDRDGYFDLVKL